MSDSPQVEIQRIQRVSTHPNADRLDLVKVLDWTCVASRDQLRAGDLVVYFPVDTVLPEEVQKTLQGDSKVKVGERIKTVKLRGVFSQGMVVPLSDFPQLPAKVGMDVSTLLGCTKHDPDLDLPKTMSFQGNAVKQYKYGNIDLAFPKYSSFTHLARSGFLFDPMDAVVVTEKLHGTSARYGWVPRQGKLRRAVGWLKGLFGRPDKGIFYVGSRNVPFAEQGAKDQHAFYSTNVYLRMAKTLKLADKLSKGEVVYGEIVGPGIQKGWQYTEELSFYVYDVTVNGVFLDDVLLDEFCRTRNLTRVPVLARIGFFEFNPEDYNQSAFPATICEGVVIRTQKETAVGGQRALAKFVRPEYRMANDKAGGTEFH